MSWYHNLPSCSLVGDLLFIIRCGSGGVVDHTGVCDGGLVEEVVVDGKGVVGVEECCSGGVDAGAEFVDFGDPVATAVGHNDV